MILYLLNLFDLLSTLYALSIGLVEMNPIMNFCISIHPLAFTLIKLSAFPLCLWLERNSKLYPIVTAVFAVTVGWNLFNIAAVLAV